MRRADTVSNPPQAAMLLADGARRPHPYSALRSTGGCVQHAAALDRHVDGIVWPVADNTAAAYGH